MNDDYEDLLDEIDHWGEGLTGWEAEFVSDLQDRMPGELTDAQMEKLEEIHERRVEGA